MLFILLETLQINKFGLCELGSFAVKEGLGYVFDLSKGLNTHLSMV